MVSVRITRWQPGFKKVSCTQLLQRELGLSLSIAKVHTDEILDGIPLSIPLDSREHAELLAAQLVELGLEVTVHG